LPKVYAALGTPAGQTDYFVWSKGGVAAPLAAENLKIETLACRVLQQMGLLKL
jgi:hypothetical protein